MMINSNDIRLFTSTETNFNHNKYVLDETIECSVTETTDGIFDLDLIYPLNDEKQFSSLLARNNIIKCAISQTDSRGEQLFTIRKRTVNTKDNRVTIYAQAKARRDLDVNMVLGVKTDVGMTRKQACQMILDKCIEQQGYTIGNLDTNTTTSINLGLDDKTGDVIDYLAISGISPLKAFLDDSQNSIVKAWGGEIIYNNNEINIVDERGNDYNILIESGKNLEELQQEIDDTDTENFATAVLPCSSDGVYLPNSEIIYSPNASVLGKTFKKVVFDDVTLVNGTDEASQTLYAQLRERTQKLFDDGLDKLKINNTVKYIQVMNTEEYKPYRKLFTEKCEIGNSVTVRYYMNNDPSKYIDATGRVVKIKFNVLKNRIEEIEIGEKKKKSVLDTITSTSSTADTTTQKVNSVVQTGSTASDYKLSERAFKECCIGASNNYTKINEEGATIYDGQFRMYKGSNIIFYVNTNGKCTADGGFVVDDGDTNCTITADGGFVINNSDYECKINSDGIRIVNKSTGYTGLITVDEATRLHIPDDLSIGDFLYVGGNARINNNLTVSGDLTMEGTLTINGQTLEEIIDSRIPDSSSGSN